jgi:hypothetical protein
MVEETKAQQTEKSQSYLSYFSRTV